MSVLLDSGQRWLEDAPCAYLVTKLDGQISWTNRTLAEWMGDAEMDLSGRSIHDVLTPGGRIRFETIAPALTLNSHLRDVALDIRCVDGTQLHLLCHATVSPTADGADTEVWWVGLDVTERRAYERDLLVAQRRLRRLQDLAAALVGATTVDEVANALLAKLVDGVKASSGVVYLRTNGDTDLRMAASRTTSAPEPQAESGPIDRHSRTALDTGQDVFDSDVERRDGQPASSEVERRRHVAALLLRADDRVVGVVRFELARQKPHTANERQLLRSAVDMAAQAIERVQFLERHRRTAEQNRAASALLHWMEEATTVATRAQLIADFMVPVYADFATVEMLAAGSTPVGLRHCDPTKEPTLRWLRSNVVVPADRPESLAAVRATQQPTVLNDIDARSFADYGLDEDQLAALRELAPRCYAGLPLVARGEVIGSLLLAHTTSGRRFSEADVEFLARVADTCALALENARLYEHERGVAQQLQRALLPDRLPDDPRVELHGFYEAGHEMSRIGGDWYDAFMLDKDRLALVVGDVVGGGLGAATTMAELRVAARAFASDGHGVADVVDRLNRFAGTVDGATGSSLVYAELDLAGNHLSYACAGHPPPVIHTPGEEPVLLWDGRRPLLAITDSPTNAGETMLSPGSSVVLYTDGLIERRGRILDDGLALLTSLLASESDLAARPATLAERLRTNVHSDDTCLLTARISDTSESSVSRRTAVAGSSS